MNMQIIKKNGNREPFDASKIIAAVDKSAARAEVVFTDEQHKRIVDLVLEKMEMIGNPEIPVDRMHTLVELALDEVNPKVSKQYRDYRNYKQEMKEDWAEANEDMDKILYRGDKSNGNADSSLNSTISALESATFHKTRYKRNFLTEKERHACKTGFIYIHDMSRRGDMINCCLFRVGHLLKNGFEMGNIKYTEPKTLDVAFDVIADIVMSAASQQYGGFTLPQVDKILSYYAEKSYKLYYDEEIAKMEAFAKRRGLELNDEDRAEADRIATEKVAYDYKQGFQGWEIKFNTVGSSRGDYPFVTVTAGLDTSRFGRMGNIIMYDVHKNGQGEKGHKKPVLFPKYVFLYDEELHGEGKELRDVYEAGLDCSHKAMYPDWLSLTGEGYVPSMYKKYNAVISPMGCRAFLSPWYKVGKIQKNPDGTDKLGPDNKPLRDHFYPAEDMEDEPVFEGRFNSGAISLNLPLILLKSRAEDRAFYDVLDEYLEMIRQVHIRTRDHLLNVRASTNPLGFCEGGFYGGNLKWYQKLKENPELIDSTTWSFGITALNELQRAYNGKSITEDGAFAKSVLEYINDKAQEFKEKDHMLYAIYGTPAESLCGLQIKQIRNYTKYHEDELRAAGYDIKLQGEDYVIPNVSDRAYVSNSFHCHVSEDISPIMKQDLENRFWNLSNGGKIQYVRYPNGHNKEAMRTLIDRAMQKGFYEGCNMALSYCDDCGHEELEMDDKCPCCGSTNLTKIDRMNGYLSYSRVKGDTRLNEAKMAEIADRKSM